MDAREKRAMHDIKTAQRRLCEALRRQPGTWTKSLAKNLEYAVEDAVDACAQIREDEEQV